MVKWRLCFRGQGGVGRTFSLSHVECGVEVSGLLRTAVRRADSAGRRRAGWQGSGSCLAQPAHVLTLRGV